MLALQVVNELVDVCHHDGEFSSCLRGEFPCNLIEILTFEKSFPDVRPNRIQAEKLISLDIENDRSIVVND